MLSALFWLLTAPCRIIRLHCAGEFPSVPYRTLDAGNLGAMLLLPTANGAMRQPVARRFYIGVFLAGLATVLLTDWDADTSR